MTHARNFLEQTARIAGAIDHDAVERLAHALADLRARDAAHLERKRDVLLDNCSHAVNDFRKLAGIEAYSPCDNVAELTARINDEGWETVFSSWLQTSRATRADAILVMSVGGGDAARKVSPNIVRALDEARSVSIPIYGIVGRDGGYTAKVADIVIVVPVVDRELVTPHTEAFQAVVWHCLVSHPALSMQKTRWESLDSAVR